MANTIHTRQSGDPLKALVVEVAYYSLGSAVWAVGRVSRRWKASQWLPKGLR